MLRLWMLVAALALVCGPLRAEGEKAGAFDYYVMALSWSSNWCASEGDRRGEPQCAPKQDITFVLHGLWPQYERGYPSYCRTTAQDPARSETAKMVDVFGGAGAAFYQWKKHGRCAGLSSTQYFQLAREAFTKIRINPVFGTLKKDVRLPASVVEDAFLEANPQLKRDQVTVMCKGREIQEVRICLTKDLHPRRCGADVIRDCNLKDALMQAVR